MIQAFLLTALTLLGLIQQMKEKMEVDTDRFPELIVEAETFANGCPDSASVAILHSMLAEMYDTYYQQNQRKIDQRTQLKDYIPTDIREWTTNIFEDKIKQELTSSLQFTPLLQDTPISAYKEIISEGKDSEILRPTLYEFLAFRALELCPTEEVYKEVFTFQSERGHTQAALLTELDYLAFRYGGKTDKGSYDAYLAALNEFSEKVSSQPYAIEVSIAKMELMRRQGYRHYAQDSIQGEEVRLCEEGIQRYPDYPRTPILENRLAQLRRPFVNVTTDNTVYPTEKAAIKLSYKNIAEISLEIYRVDKSPAEVAVYPYNAYSEQKDKLSGQLVSSTTHRLHLPNQHSRQDTILYVPLDQLGQYECVVTAKEQELQVATPLSVSHLAAIYRTLPNNERQVVVTDYRSGQPIEGATVTYYGGNRKDLKKQGSVQTDPEGLATLPNEKRILAFQASLPNDRNGRLTQLYTSSSARSSKKEVMEISLFTDRGLYRPGQTVYFKGIAYVKETDDPHVVADQSISVSLHDTNGKEITRQTFTTNAFGSFNGEFTLPQQTLNGSFRLSAERTNTYIHVEEYKRPTFQAYFLPLKEEITFGDSMRIEGKVIAFSGVNLPSGEVSWRITRRSYLLRGSFMPTSTEQIAEGNTTIDEAGTFSIPFLPQKEANDGSSLSYQTYEVTATVTDSKGETQEASTSFTVGESSIILFSNLAKRVDKEAVDAIIEAKNLNGAPIQVSGSFSLTALIEDTNGSYTEGKQLAFGSFISGEKIHPKTFQDLPSGRYRLEMEAKDKQGRTCLNQTDFILYSTKDKKPPVFSHTWVVEEKTKCLAGEEAKIIFGTSDKDTYLLYEWFKDNERIHHESIRLSEANRSFHIPFKEDYGDGIVASFTFVKEGKLYTTQVPIQRQQPDRKLSIKPTSFRDKLLSGGKETWKFHIADADSIITQAEVLAGMYDASLDKILPFHWSFAPERYIRLQAPSFKASIGLNRSQQQESSEIELANTPTYQYHSLNWMGVLHPKRARAASYAMDGDVMLMRSAVASVSATDAVAMEVAVASEDTEIEEELVDNESFEDLVEKENEPFLGLNQVRQNFSELAFFYPTLQTNEEGDIIIGFTLPESHTTWKLQLLANSQDLKYGLLTKEVISNKPLMVSLNLPRFVREGDEVSVNAQVINHSEEEQEGRVRIELFDPATDQPIVCLTKAQHPFQLRPDSVATVNWSFPVPKSIQLMGIRIVADSETASDGEQHLLPVLPNQLLITKSTPFYLSDKKERQIKVSGSEAGKTPYRLTIEVSGNPIWQAVQALPTITQPNDENILSWFASYYGNTLATFIAQSNPRIQKIIEAWMTEGKDVTTLYSNLEKNQELKEILLEETPWVMEAHDETEQKQRLSLLFDLNHAADLQETALQKLIQQQEEDGGWSWFKGFPTSRRITLSILRGMSQLSKLQAVQYGDEAIEMQIKALQFLDKKIEVDYEKLKSTKNGLKGKPSAEQVEYLLVRSSFHELIDEGTAKDAIRFYTDQAEKHWKAYDIRTKGEIALLAYRDGEKDVARDILAWLKKTATTSEEMGTYWANNRREGDYFHSPIETHCLLMSAFEEIEPNNTFTDQMKQWLLNQKRTQAWESTPATVNAIYSLLLTGSDWLTTSNTCVVKWDKQTYSTDSGETGIGYLKVELPQSPSLEEPAISIRKEGKAPAWGAVYEQYFQTINEMEGQEGALSVNKQLFIEINNGTDIQMHPITTERQPQIGDKVITRLTIRADREMDYVVLKDLRAGCLEPISQVSFMERRDGLSYYHSSKDASENFFIERLPKGTFVLEYEAFVTREGEYTSGISTIQCLYAPEFVSHAAGETLHCQNK